jgi:hypothetical protein
MGFKKEYKIYGDLLFQHKPTIRTLILHMFYSRFIKKERAKLPVYRENAEFKDPEFIPENIQIKYIALVSDGEVKELIRLQKYVADIMLSKKTKLVEFDPEQSQVKKGTKYKDGQFLKED